MTRPRNVLPVGQNVLQEVIFSTAGREVSKQGNGVCKGPRGGCEALKCVREGEGQEGGSGDLDKGRADSLKRGNEKMGRMPYLRGSHASSWVYER